MAAGPGAALEALAGGLLSGIASWKFGVYVLGTVVLCCVAAIAALFLILFLLQLFEDWKKRPF